jgi:hypothetical protein
VSLDMAQTRAAVKDENCTYNAKKEQQIRRRS